MINNDQMKEIEREIRKKEGRKGNKEDQINQKEVIKCVNNALITHTIHYLFSIYSFKLNQ